jgi:hypothetical protein
MLKVNPVYIAYCWNRDRKILKRYWSRFQKVHIQPKLRSLLFKQEALGRTDRLLYFDKTRTA